MKKRKVKTAYEIAKEIRQKWLINPKTRVKCNEKKNVKKIRQKNKKEILDYRKGDNYVSPYLCVLYNSIINPQLEVS